MSASINRLGPAVGAVVNNNPAANNGLMTNEELASRMNMDQFKAWSRADQGADDRQLVISGANRNGGGIAPQPVDVRLVPNGRVRNIAPERLGPRVMLNNNALQQQLGQEASVTTNNDARQVFLKLILKECGVTKVDDLPKSVKCAMRIKHWNIFKRVKWEGTRSWTLNARRVREVVDAVETYKADVNAKARAAGLGEDWLAVKAHKELWDGLSTGLKNKVLSEDGKGLLKALSKSYDSIREDSRADFIETVNRFHEKWPKLKNPIPLGNFRFFGSGSVGKCFTKQLESSTIGLTNPTLKNVLERYMRTKTTVRINNYPTTYTTKDEDGNVKSRSTGGGTIDITGYPEETIENGVKIPANTVRVWIQDGEHNPAETYTLCDNSGDDNNSANNGKRMTYEAFGKMLKDKLGITDQQVLVLLSKMSPEGVTSFLPRSTPQEKKDEKAKNYMAAFAKTVGLPPGDFATAESYAGIVDFKGNGKFGLTNRIVGGVSRYTSRRDGEDPETLSVEMDQENSELSIGYTCGLSFSGQKAAPKVSNMQVDMRMKIDHAKSAGIYEE